MQMDWSLWGSDCQSLFCFVLFFLCCLLFFGVIELNVLLLCVPHMYCTFIGKSRNKWISNTLILTEMMSTLLLNMNFCCYTEPQGNGGNSGGAGGSSKGPQKDWWNQLFENQQQIWIAVACAAAAGLLLFSSGNQTREINWQEFRTNYLGKGEVLCTSLVK